MKTHNEIFSLTCGCSHYIGRNSSSLTTRYTLVSKDYNQKLENHILSAAVQQIIKQISIIILNIQAKDL